MVRLSTQVNWLWTKMLSDGNVLTKLMIHRHNKGTYWHLVPCQNQSFFQKYHKINGPRKCWIWQIFNVISALWRWNIFYANVTESKSWTGTELFWIKNFDFLISKCLKHKFRINKNIWLKRFIGALLGLESKPSRSCDFFRDQIKAFCQGRLNTSSCLFTQSHQLGKTSAKPMLGYSICWPKSWTIRFNFEFVSKTSKLSSQFLSFVVVHWKKMVQTQQSLNRKSLTMQHLNLESSNSTKVKLFTFIVMLEYVFKNAILTVQERLLR